jgi:hypothetical protein
VAFVVPAGELPDPGLFVGALPVGVLTGTKLSQGALSTADGVSGFGGRRDANLTLVIPAGLTGSALPDVRHPGFGCVWVGGLVDVSLVSLPLGLDVRELMLVRNRPVLVLGLDACLVIGGCVASSSLLAVRHVGAVFIALCALRRPVVSRDE